MDFGKALKVARAIAGLQQKDLAKRARLDPSHISLIESGRRKPSSDAMGRISSALGIPVHLVMLLAAEPKDLKIADGTELNLAARSLAHLILKNGSRIQTRTRGRSSTRNKSEAT
jgi:transcriptional regulator with XRE-family HTH domain